jgi:PEP-CTERM motif
VIDSNADATGFNSPFGTIHIWGPNTPVGNSDPNHSYPGPGSHPVGPVNNGWGNIPDGSYAFGADAAYANAPISQTINGLQAGHTYDLSFSYAGAQFTDALGVNTEGWHVTLGSDLSTDTTTLNNASQGFTGWQTFSTTFTASTTSETLTFLANGGPLGLPPFALLDNVVINEHTTTPPPSTVPEPSTIVLVGSSLFLIGAARSLRKKN